MKTDRTSPSGNRWPNHVLIALASLLLLLPLLDMGFHLDPTSPRSENRLLAAWPSLPVGGAGLQNYLKNWEAYFNDHFGCRRVMVMWQNKLRRALFKDNSPMVLAGTQGWLYYSYTRMVDYYRGQLKFTEAELQDWQKLLEGRRNWLAQYGIKYIFVITPDKQTIYPEYLPEWLKNLGSRTKADQFFDYMKQHSTVAVLDLRPALLASKPLAVTYKNTDTHWNSFGAFIGCERLVQALAELPLSGMTPISLDYFERTNRPAPGGDLAQMLGVNRAEKYDIIFSPKLGLPNLEIFESKDNPNKRTAFSKQPGKPGLAFVYHDSFGHYWVPFLGYHFGEVDYFWQTHFDPEMIKRKQPVVVIDQVIERFLNIGVPKELTVKDALP